MSDGFEFEIISHYKGLRVAKIKRETIAAPISST